MVTSHTGRNVAIILVIFILIGAFGVTVPIIPISYQEPYEVSVPYEAQEAYTVQVPYTVEVEVTKTKTVVDHTFSLGSVTLKTEDFTMPSSQTATISWHSSKDVTMFGILQQETWDRLYWALVGELGLSIVLTLISGGALAPAVIASIPPIIVASMQSIASGDYYKVNDDSDVTTKNLNVDLYKLVVISFGSSGTLNAKITFNYETTETQTRYRTETRYRTVTKYRTETHYRTKTVKVTLWELITDSY